MENTENFVEVQTTEPETQNAPTFEKNKSSFGAKVKEFFRKQAVGLKRKPQRIALIFLSVVTIYNLLTLATFSEAIVKYSQAVEWVGLMVFINTLFSILILVAFLNTFPKLKKSGSKVTFTMTEQGIKLNVNIPMLIVMLLMAIAMIVCEIVYYNLMGTFYKEQMAISTSWVAGPLIASSRTLSIVHIILLAVFLVILLTLPLYRKLIMKINTSVKVESATENMKEIDLQD